MSILAELKTITEELKIPVETGAFTDVAPNTYLVLTPIIDSFSFYGDDAPLAETSEVRISLFSKENYVSLVRALVKNLIRSEFTVTDRRYIGYETETGYHHFAVDVAKTYEYDKEE